MRFLPIALLAAASCGPPAWQGRLSSDEQETHVMARPNVESARELDQEGVRAFRDGRFADAARYFRTAYRLGGPSSELWNIARSLERIDDVEGAAAAIDAYLAHRDLSSQDRAEAEHELYALRSHPSTLTVTTTPPGATVILDAKQVLGVTPLSVDLPAGAHSIALRRDGYAAQSRAVEARLGRAVIVALDLARAGK
jgi:hypothetical protein